MSRLRLLRVVLRLTQLLYLVGLFLPVRAERWGSEFTSLGMLLLATCWCGCFAWPYWLGDEPWTFVFVCALWLAQLTLWYSWLMFAAGRGGVAILFAALACASGLSLAFLPGGNTFRTLGWGYWCLCAGALGVLLASLAARGDLAEQRRRRQEQKESREKEVATTLERLADGGGGPVQ